MAPDYILAGEYFQGQHEALVSQEVFDLAQRPYGHAGSHELEVDGHLGSDRIETQTSQEVTRVTIDGIDKTALETPC